MISIKKALKALADKVDAPIVFSSKSLAGYDFGANQYRKLQSTVSMDGYTPHVIGAYCTSGGTILVQNAFLSNGTTLNIECYNRTSSASNNQSFTIYIMWTKD